MKKILHYFRSFVQQYKGAIIGYIALTILHKVLTFISPPMVQCLIDAAVSGDINTFFAALITNVTITIAFVIVLYFRNLHGALTENQVTAFAEKRVFSDMLRMPNRELQKKPLGHYLHIIDRDVNQITGLAFYDWIVFATNVLMVIAMLVYLIQCDWVLSIVVILVLPAFVLLSKGLLPKIETFQKQVITQQENLNDKMDECYTGNEYIRTANAEGFFMKRFEHAVSRWLQAKKPMFAMRTNTMYSPSQDL